MQKLIDKSRKKKIIILPAVANEKMYKKKINRSHSVNSNRIYIFLIFFHSTLPFKNDHVLLALRLLFFRIVLEKKHF